MPEDQPTEPRTLTPEPFGGRRIPLVEDSPDVSEILAMNLEVAGHQVTEARTGPEALDAAARSRPDPILLDLGLPGMEGYEVARRLHESPETAGIPIVALTGYGAEEDRERTAAAGFAGHLTKPVHVQDLHRVIGDLASQDTG